MLAWEINMSDSAEKRPSSSCEEDSAVTKFREYLRIRSVQPDPDYDNAVIFLSRLAKEIDLEFDCIEVHPKKPVVILKWEGTDISLPSILLNSHTDVVPVFEEHWKYDPFAAVKEENGDIYARGTQDMKCVGIQYIEAIRKLKLEGKRCLRTVYLTFVPDEEIGGTLGMNKFVKREEFKKMNVGFALDEGLANPTEAFKAYNGQRSVWWVKITCTGNPGHGSRFIENTAMEKLQKVINCIMEYRASEKAKLEATCSPLGDVTTCNINMINGGQQVNVVPSEYVMCVDIRICHAENLVEFEEKLNTWVKNAGDGVSYEFLQKEDSDELTSVDENDPWWSAFMAACNKLNMKIETEVFSAAIDARYLRKIGIPAIGFSPMNNTPVLLHDHNEFLNENIFLRGIDIYCEIISSLANVSNA